MKHFKLHAACIPVLGAKNAIICDLFRERYLRVPHEIATLIQKNKVIKIENEVDAVDTDLDKLILLLERDDWGHFTEIPDQFPDLDLRYEHTGMISNCIIDIDDKIDYSFNSVIDELDSLGCNAIQIRFYKTFELTYVVSLFKYFQDTSIQFVEILLQYHDDLFDESHIRTHLLNELRLKNIYIFSSPKDEVVTFTNEKSGHQTKVIYSSSDFKNEDACGHITKDRFIINLTNFTEAKNFNSCLNCKVSIDKSGNIKNCPSLKENYGNIKRDSIKSVIQNERYLKHSLIKKDDIEVCKDCEYRYICTDCRAHLTGDGLSLSKPANCSYDPYLGSWG